MLILLQILDRPKAVFVDEHIEQISRLTRKEPSQIRNIFQGSFPDRESSGSRFNRPPDIDRDKMWSMFDFGDLKKPRFSGCIKGGIENNPAPANTSSNRSIHSLPRPPVGDHRRPGSAAHQGRRRRARRRNRFAVRISAQLLGRLHGIRTSSAADNPFSATRNIPFSSALKEQHCGLNAASLPPIPGMKRRWPAAAPFWFSTTPPWAPSRSMFRSSWTASQTSLNSMEDGGRGEKPEIPLPLPDICSARQPGCVPSGWSSGSPPLCAAASCDALYHRRFSQNELCPLSDRRIFRRHPDRHDLHNLALYLFIRDRQYLFYITYIGFLLLWQCVLVGLFQYIWPPLGAFLMSGIPRCSQP